VATPVFDGVRDNELMGLLGSTLPTSDGLQLVEPNGKARLFDGRSGEPFPYPIPAAHRAPLAFLPAPLPAHAKPSNCAMATKPATSAKA